MSARLWVVLTLAALIAAGTLLWQHTPLSEVAQPARLAAWMGSFETSRWSPLLMIGIYVLGGLVMLPLVLLVATTALVFPPGVAIGVSLTGALLNAAVLYALGAKLLSGGMHKAFRRAVDRVNRALSGRGVYTVAAVRMIPIAPFSIVNLVAGSIGIGFREYLIGTALGLAPGIVVLSLFGHQVRSLLQEPTAGKVLLTVAIAVAWLALSFGLQRFTSRWNVREGETGSLQRREYDSQEKRRE